MHATRAESSTGRKRESKVPEKKNGGEAPLSPKSKVSATRTGQLAEAPARSVSQSSEVRLSPRTVPSAKLAPANPGTSKAKYPDLGEIDKLSKPALRRLLKDPGFPVIKRIRAATALLQGKPGADDRVLALLQFRTPNALDKVLTQEAKVAAVSKAILHLAGKAKSTPNWHTDAQDLILLLTPLQRDAVLFNFAASSTIASAIKTQLVPQPALDRLTELHWNLVEEACQNDLDAKDRIFILALIANPNMQDAAVKGIVGDGWTLPMEVKDQLQKDLVENDLGDPDFPLNGSEIDACMRSLHGTPENQDPHLLSLRSLVLLKDPDNDRLLSAWQVGLNFAELEQIDVPAMGSEIRQLPPTEGLTFTMHVLANKQNPIAQKAWQSRISDIQKTIEHIASGKVGIAFSSPSSPLERFIHQAAKDSNPNYGTTAHDPRQVSDFLSRLRMELALVELELDPNQSPSEEEEDLLDKLRNGTLNSEDLNDASGAVSWSRRTELLDASQARNASTPAHLRGTVGELRRHQLSDELKALSVTLRHLDKVRRTPAEHKQAIASQRQAFHALYGKTKAPENGAVDRPRWLKQLGSEKLSAGERTKAAIALLKGKPSGDDRVQALLYFSGKKSERKTLDEALAPHAKVEAVSRAVQHAAAGNKAEAFNQGQGQKFLKLLRSELQLMHTELTSGPSDAEKALLIKFRAGTLTRQDLQDAENGKAASFIRLQEIWDAYSNHDPSESGYDSLADRLSKPVGALRRAQLLDEHEALSVTLKRIDARSDEDELVESSEDEV